MSRYHILKNKRVYPAKDVTEWAKWLTTKSEEKVVAQEDLPNGLWVSTVFLGLDHSFLIKKGLVFETMVFKRRKDGTINYGELDLDRYSTWGEAVKGHERMVAKWSKK